MRKTTVLEYLGGTSNAAAFFGCGPSNVSQMPEMLPLKSALFAYVYTKHELVPDWSYYGLPAPPTTKVEARQRIKDGKVCWRDDGK